VVVRGNTVLSLILAAGLAAFANGHQAKAALIDYHLESEFAPFGFLTTGTFTFDASLNQVVDENISFSSNNSGLVNETFTTAMLKFDASNNSLGFTAFDPATAQTLIVTLANDLGLDAVDPLADFAVGRPLTGSGISVPSRGAASPVPEPPAFVLLASGLLAAAFVRGRRFRCEARRPGQSARRLTSAAK
jgi:hypothetical protein